MPKFIKFYPMYLVILCLSVFLTIVVVKNKIVGASSVLGSTNKLDPAKAAEFSQEKIDQIREEKKSLGILLLGYGGPGHQGGMLTDVIQLLYFDFEKTTVSMISIPRDLWVELPNGKQGKMNKAFTMGDDSQKLINSGGQVSKEMAELIIALPVDYFFALDFVGFQRLIGEVLKGIDVKVVNTLDDPWYPIKGEELNPCGYSPEEIAELTNKSSGFELEKQFECRYEHVYFKPGVVEMHGGDALKFVRSRHGSSAGDFSRSQRQQAVLVGVLKKLLSLDGLKKAPEFFKQASYTFSTDFDLEIIEHLLPAFENIGKFEQKSIILSTENVFVSSKSSSGQFILIPKAGVNNWKEVHQFLQNKL